MTGDIADTDLRATLDTLGMSISQLNVIMAKLSDGEGSAAKLLDDPALYDSLATAAGNLATLLQDLEANPGRYVHFSLFGKRDKKVK
jgi:phospholipid/cholesterol/gamma-HCH transport system substrate-binding protein